MVPTNEMPEATKAPETPKAVRPTKPTVKKVTAPKTATAKAAPKTAPKRTAKPTVSKPAKAAAQPKVNTHIEAGINVSRYEGLSKFVNSNRRVQIMAEYGPDGVTDRAAKGLYALRECYGNKAFKPKGFDNGILRRLLGAGLISVTGGQKQTIDGALYIIDGETPVQAHITAAGMKYGSPKAA